MKHEKMIPEMGGRGIKFAYKLMVLIYLFIGGRAIGYSHYW